MSHTDLPVCHSRHPVTPHTASTTKPFVDDSQHQENNTRPAYNHKRRPAYGDDCVALFSLPNVPMINSVTPICRPPADFWPTQAVAW